MPPAEWIAPVPLQGLRADFSLTSGTLFAFHKLPLRTYLLAAAIFANGVKGKSALALSRDLGTQYKTAYVMAYKIREAMASEIKGVHVGSEGTVAEVDGGYSARRASRPDRPPDA